MRISVRIAVAMYFAFSAYWLDAAPAKLSEIRGQYMGKWLTSIVDPEHSLTLEDVLKKKESFVPCTADIPSYGMTNQGFWFHGELINDTDTNDWVFQFGLANVDEVDLYLLYPGQERVQMRAGQAVSFFDFPLERAKPTFPLELYPGEKVEFYFHAADAGILSFPLKIDTAEADMAEFGDETMVMGLYFGILTVMVLYNLFLFFSTRMTSYFYYCIYLVGMIMSIAIYRGYCDQYFWPTASVWWKNYSAFLFSSAFLCYGAIAFMASFLQITEKDTFIYRSYRFLRTYYLVAGIVYAFLPLIYFVHLWAIFSMAGFMLSIYAAVVYYRRGYQPARLYLLSWLVLIIGTFLILLKFMGAIRTNFLSEYGVQIGSAMEAVLLALALADRIRLLQAEKEEIRLDSLQNRHRVEILGIKQKLYEQDLDKARRIQASLIPKLQNDIRLAGFYLPMEKVGGDYFDVIAFDKKKERLGLFISDVSGHGVQAALLTVMIKGIVHNHLMNTDLGGLPSGGPNRMMEQLNKMLFPYLDGNFVSAFYAILDTKKRSIAFTSAAHPPPILLEPDKKNGRAKLSFLNTSPQGPPIGLANEVSDFPYKYRVKTLKLPKGSRLLLYSDGFTDTIGYDYENMEAGIDSFENTAIYPVLAKTPKVTNRETIEDLSRVMIDCSRGEMADDICALSIQID